MNPESVQAARGWRRARVLGATALAAIAVGCLLFQIPYNLVFDGQGISIQPITATATAPTAAPATGTTDSRGQIETSKTGPSAEQSDLAEAFARPILNVIAARPPDFEDDFAGGGPGWGWDTHLAGQVEIAGGVMRVEGPGGHGIFPPHDQLRSRNFVLEFDARLETPGGIGVFFRQQDADEWYSLSLGNPETTWSVIALTSARALPHGADHVLPVGETNHVLVLAHGNRFAVYLNAQPVAYFEDPTHLNAGYLLPTFHGVAEGIPMTGEFDNFRFWDLERIPELVDEPGSILFTEDFESGDANSFSYLSGDWQLIEDETGNSVLEGSFVEGQDQGLGAGFGPMHRANYAVEYRVRSLDRDGDAWLNFRNNSDATYVQRLSVRYQHLGLYYGPHAGRWQPLQEPAVAVQSNIWYTVRVEAQDASIRVYIDDALVIEYGGAHADPGDLAIGALPGSRVQFDDIRVIALDEVAATNPHATQARAFAEPILAAIQDRPPDYADEFGDPGSGWSIGTRVAPAGNQELGQQGYAGGEYFVEAAAGRCNSGGSDALPRLRDLVLEVHGRLTGSLAGDWQVHMRNEYAVAIEPGGIVILGSDEQGEAVSLIRNENPLISGGARIDQVQIIARGPQLAVFVNGDAAAYLDDPRRDREGNMSLAVCSSGDTPARALWDDLKIWDISDLP